ncbi:MAG: hypothetical protein JXB06_09090 [Spirochaetales bacterium]|nr:hypothetical protein [Spirochaetales bacterium]
MKRRAVSPALPTLLLMLLLSPGVLGAQESGPQVEPQEPDIVLPEVILRIEDFSVEEVEAGVPGERQLSAPERTIPLPEVGELEIGEPEIPFAAGEGRDLVSPPERASGLSAQAILGAGTLSHLYSQISLNRIGGEEPRFKLRFLHEMLDGVALPDGEEAGSGFHTREDRLEAGIRFHLGSLGLEVEGLLQDQERGLQRQAADFIAHDFRQGEVDARLDLPLGERLTLSGGAQAGFATQLMAGDNPDDTRELLIEPVVKLEFRHGSISTGLEGQYSNRSASGEQALQRVGAHAFFSADFLENYRIEARGGWAWNSDLGHLFPFSVSLSGTPFSTFSFTAAGGYRIERLNYLDLLAGYPLPELPPGTLADNHGWFADLGLSFTLARNLSLQAQAGLAWSSDLLLPEQGGWDPVSGLFGFTQSGGVQLGTDVRLRWNMGSLVTLSGGLHTELIDRAPNTPLHSGVVEIEGMNAAATWGARGSLELALGYPPEETNVSLMPVLSASGFYNITDTISLIAELDDLLFAFAGERWLTSRLPSGQLFSWHPYQAAGTRGTVKVQINL